MSCLARCLKVLTAFEERHGEVRFACEVQVGVAGEDVAEVVALFGLVAAACL